jgi:hypothetical protein
VAMVEVETKTWMSRGYNQITTVDSVRDGSLSALESIGQIERNLAAEGRD